MSSTLKKDEQQEKLSTEQFNLAAEQIYKEYTRRKTKRSGMEKRMLEIDRQIRMEAQVLYKRNADGTTDNSKAWMPEVELPNQAEALEVLVADSMRLIFPENEAFFEAHTYCSDEYLSLMESESQFIMGSYADQPDSISINNVNRYVEGFVENALRKFDHQQTWKLIISESIKYGVGVGRVRKVLNSVCRHESKGSFVSDKKIAVLIPLSLYDAYLDDNDYNYLNSGFAVSGSVILKQRKNYADLMKQVKIGGSEDGWVKDALSDVQADKDGFIDVLEYEGDLIFPEHGENEFEFIPNVIVTTVRGKGEEGKVSRIIRIEYKEDEESSFIAIAYGRDDPRQPYSSSPLQKGYVVQYSGSFALNILLQAAMLGAQPVLNGSSDDKKIAAKGGLAIFPGAQILTDQPLDVLKIGDVNSMLPVYSAFLSQYADVTGVNPPRLGAQTVSHTTAYAKNQEIERGSARTVEFVRGLIPKMERWIGLCYKMSKDCLYGEDVFFVEEAKTFVHVRKDLLPDVVYFKVNGANQPQEDYQKEQLRKQSVMTAIQANQIGVQLGVSQPLNFDQITKEELAKGGYTDVDLIVGGGVPIPTQGGQSVQGVDGGAGGGTQSNSLPIALQGLQRAVE